ncbi:MAG: hypothetical protein Kow0025_16440 [Thermodesulfovibrionales bacterium]
MFDLGMQELVVIFIVALLVFGPKKLPELGRTLGKGISELKKAMFDVKKEVYKEMYPPIEEGKEALYGAKEMWGEVAKEAGAGGASAEGSGEGGGEKGEAETPSAEEGEAAREGEAPEASGEAGRKDGADG